MRTILCLVLALAMAACSQFERYDGGDDDDASSRDGNVATDTVADAAVADAATADADADAATVIIVDTSAVDAPPDADDAQVAPDAPDAPDVVVADSRAVDSGAADSGSPPADVPPADTGCGGFSGATCCPGTGALRCGSQWFGCYGGACHCGGVGQVCCRTGCNTGLRCGAVTPSTCDI